VQISAFSFNSKQNKEENNEELKREKLFKKTKKVFTCLVIVSTGFRFFRRVTTKKKIKIVKEEEGVCICSENKVQRESGTHLILVGSMRWCWLTVGGLQGRWICYNYAAAGCYSSAIQSSHACLHSPTLRSQYSSLSSQPLAFHA
jgi:hypothetical protein